MSEVVIRAEKLGKKYLLRHAAEGRTRYRALRDVLAGALRSFPRKLAQLFRGGGGAAGGTSEEFWALRDVSFEVNEGDVVGIIGRNGAGKSTLLKVLSRITAPSTGRVTIQGRVASLLEVGTGFHPELSGRENIYLNGAILGMTRQEIRRKFDEIVAFAEVEKFLDTPVKRYSSGMYVRLAFAVAAHLEPEILLVDEVLSVGDTAFQKKCLQKVRSVSRSGRTIFYVSHNIGSVLDICNKGILLEQGRVRLQGAVKEVVAGYFADLDGSQSGLDARSFRGPLSDTVFFHRLTINDVPAGGNTLVAPSDGLRVTVRGEARAAVPDFRTTFSIFRDGVRLLSMHDVGEPEFLPAGSFEAAFEVPPCLLRPGEYTVALGGRRVSGDDWVWGTDLATFIVLEEWGPGCDRDDLGLVNSPGRGRRLVLHADRNGVGAGAR